MMMKKVLNIILALTVSLYSSAQVGTYVVSTVAGNGQSGYNGDGGLSINSQISTPYEIVSDDNNNIYFADQTNKRIRKIDAQTNIISTIVDSTNSIVNNANFTPNLLEFSNNAIYFVDVNKLFKYDFSTNYVSLIYTLSTSNISYFTVKGDSIFYVPSSSTQIDLLYDINNVPFLIQNYSSASSNMYQYTYYEVINDVLIDNNGDVLVLNIGTNGNEVVRLNQSNYQAEVVVNSSLLSFPEGFAVDSNNDIYIADQGHHQIFTYKNNTMSVFAGTGSMGYKDTITDYAMFNAPVKLAIDNSNKMYVSDIDNHRIRLITESCSPANLPEISLTAFNYANCPDNVYLSVNNPILNLNDNINWVWYEDSCGLNQVFEGNTITVNSHQPIKLYVRGENGCTENGECGVIEFNGIDCAPNGINTAFSPNGDGVNDFWVIDSISSNTSVSIYNRWGDLIKQIDNYNNIDKVWDGTSDIGEMVSAGTYFYIIEKNNIKISSGWVEVVR